MWTSLYTPVENANEKEVSGKLEKEKGGFT